MQQVSNRARQQEIARRLGVAPSSVNRWKTSGPKPETVRAFAVAYGRPVAEAFLAAGYLRPEDVRTTPGAHLPQRHSELLPVEETVNAIWALEALPEATRRLLILEHLERGAARSAEGPGAEGG